jgi:hypothetical protein
MRTFYREATHIANATADKQAHAEWNEKWSKFNYNNTLEERLEDYDTDAQTREETYAQFKLEPNNDELWNEVAHQAEHEEQRGENHPFLLRDVTVQDLVALADEIRDLPKDKRLGRLAELSPYGKSWAAELPGLAGISLAMNTQRLRNVLLDTKLPIDAVIFGAWDVALIDRLTATEDEIRIGWVRSANPIAEHTTLVDTNLRALEVAGELFADREVTVANSELTDLPFDSNSLELIVGNRVRQTMDVVTIKDFYIELSRVLKQGGMYIDHAGESSQSKSTYTRWKVLLSQMVIDAALPRVEPDQQISREQEIAVLAGLGLQERRFNYSGAPINVLVKRASIKSIGYHAISGRGIDQIFVVEPTTLIDQ